jgi:hypothetical protein
VADKIKKTNPYRDAMQVCRVLDMGSGQLNISRIAILRKDIEGDERGEVEYGGGWMTSKYYLQQAQERIHKVAAQEITFKEIPTPDLDGVAFKIGDLIKNIYYRRTQCGGHKEDGSTKNSKLVPITKWLQRWLYFISGKYKNIDQT